LSVNSRIPPPFANRLPCHVSRGVPNDTALPLPQAVTPHLIVAAPCRIDPVSSFRPFRRPSLRTPSRPPRHVASLPGPAGYKHEGWHAQQQAVPASRCKRYILHAAPMPRTCTCRAAAAEAVVQMQKPHFEHCTHAAHSRAKRHTLKATFRLTCAQSRSNCRLASHALRAQPLLSKFSTLLPPWRAKAKRRCVQRPCLSAAAALPVSKEMGLHRNRQSVVACNRRPRVGTALP